MKLFIFAFNLLPFLMVSAIAEDKNVDEFRRVYGQQPTELGLLADKPFETEVAKIALALTPRNNASLKGLQLIAGFDLTADGELITAETAGQSKRGYQPNKLQVRSRRLDGEITALINVLELTDEKLGEFLPKNALLNAKVGVAFVIGDFGAVGGRSEGIVFDYKKPAMLFRFSIPAAQSQLNNFRVSPDGKWLASGTKALRVWDIEKKKELTSDAFALDAAVSSLAFSPDGASLAVGSADGKISLFEVKTGKKSATLQHEDERVTKTVTALAFSPDGSQILSAGDNNLLLLWNVELRKVIHSMEVAPKPFAGAGAIDCITFHPHGDAALTTSGRQSLGRTSTLWNLRRGREVSETLVPRSVIGIFDPTGRHYFSQEDLNRFLIYKIKRFDSDAKLGREED